MSGRADAALAALGVALAATSASAQQDRVEIRARCSALGGCVFTNTGSEPGSGCATLVITGGPGQSIRSSLVCSGSLQPNSTSAAIPVGFAGTDALTFCAQQPACAPTVEVSNLRSDATPIPWSLLFALVVGGSSGWVYRDAKRIGARPGLFPGMFDLGPGGWFLCSFFLWIIAFPAYLMKREAIAKAAAATPASPPT